MQQINNLSARMLQHKELITAATNRVITSGWWILGPECNYFEQSFSAFLGVNHCVGVANGTDAIELALKAMNISPGDRVATVANAGMYTTSSLLAIGAIPLFMDVDCNNYCVTLEEVMRAFTAGVKSIVATHLYGQAIPEIAQIAQFCAENNIGLLEDCAQAHGAEINNKRVGSFGDAATFSFYPTKNLGALGDGGAVVTNNAEIAEHLRLLRQYGWSTKYKVELAGARNSRLDEIQAAILSDFLPHLDESNLRRREIAARYSQYIRHSQIQVPAKGSSDYVAHLYVIRVSERDALRAHLHHLNIASEVHYPIPDYRQPLFKDRFSNIHLKCTEQLSKETLTIPCYPEMNNDEVDQVIEAINGWNA
ncbi:MAG: DegT/DnrJ/EryC1/StrS family aminotransferase [Tatlockia sp.]|nr:DegT/DnrJ/EryC1/StrS family aminotransferase [Tatlockia sp.]